jgi:general secretion pathway protein D
MKHSFLAGADSNRRSAGYTAGLLIRFGFCLALALGVGGCLPKNHPPAPEPELTGIWGIRSSARVRGKISEEIGRPEKPRKKAVTRMEREGMEPPPLPGTIKSAPLAQKGRTVKGRVISFKDAPLGEVVGVFADLLGISIITPPNLKGTVTLHSGGEVSPQELIPLLETVLEINGFALTSQEGAYRVVPLNRAKSSPAIPLTSADLLQLKQHQGYGLEVFYLRYLSADRAMKSIRRFVSKNGDITSVQPANVLVVAESGPNLAKIRRLVALLDVPISRRVSIRTYRVENVSVKNLAKDLRNIFKAMGISQQPRTGVWADIVPLPDLHSIAVVSSVRELFPRVERWLGDLDRQIADAELGVFVYRCQSSEAKDIAGVLNSLYGSKDKKASNKTIKRTPANRPTRTRPGVKTSMRDRDRRNNVGSALAGASQPEREAPSGTTLEGGVRVVVEPNSNTIVVRAPRRQFQTLLSTIRKLDVFPRQVLIEVLIAEVTLTDALNLGLEWHNFSTTANGNRMDVNTPWSEGMVPGSGLLFTLTQADRLKVSLHALAKEGKVNVISAPLLLASEGQESSVLVGRDVPIVTDVTTSQDLSTDKKITDRSIKYRDTGINLSITPRINDSGLVRMFVQQEISGIEDKNYGETGSTLFSIRKASTNVITTDGQSIVIAGLIKEEIHEKEEGIPFLSDIPLLGYLFKMTSQTKERMELVITLTPHVIYDMADAKEILADLQDELKRVRSPSRMLRARPLTKPKKKSSGSKGAGAGESL